MTIYVNYINIEYFMFIAKSICNESLKRGSAVKLIPFFSVKFILQNCEIRDFNKFDLAFVLSLPFSQYGIESPAQI